MDRSPGPEGICLKQQAILIMKREVEKLHPSLSLRCQPLLRVRMFVGRGREGAGDLFGPSKVIPFGRASQVAFFACEARDFEI
jgi:hypothetical protein